MNLNFQEDFARTSSASDKIWRHGYQRIYPWFIRHFVGQSPIILEIGLFEGKSISLWKDYFINPQIHVCDITPLDTKTEGFYFYQVDQSKPDDWKSFKLKCNVNFFSFIIDDGSHIPEHQLTTINELWPMLADEGVYIIEDVETSYWKKSSLYGYDFNASKTSIFKSLLKVIDEINSKISHHFNASSPLKNLSVCNSGFRYANEVEFISFGYNCIILVKKSRQFQKYYSNDYNLKHKINEKRLSRIIFQRIKAFFSNWKKEL